MTERGIKSFTNRETGACLAGLRVNIDENTDLTIKDLAYSDDVP